MESLWSKLSIVEVVVLGLVGGAVLHVGFAMIDKFVAKARLKAAGITNIDITWRWDVWDRRRYQYEFSGAQDGVRVNGTISVWLLFFPGSPDIRRLGPQVRSDGPQLNDGDGRADDGAFRAEVNRRLRDLQKDRDAFMEHDVDGNGIVDDDEWNDLRRKIEEEVRAAMEDGG